MICKKIPLTAGGWTAELQLYLWENTWEVRPAEKHPLVLVCPGGAYMAISDREADPVAFSFFEEGYHGAVLRYSVAPAVFPTALTQLAMAVKLIRENSEEWFVDADRIFVAGFSAGGHLVCSLGTFWNKAFLREALQCDSALLKPSGLILGYPVITSGEFAHDDSFRFLLGDKYGEKRKEMSLEHQVTEDMPPVFLWHTQEDELVPVENSLLLYAALQKHKVPAELHIFPKGHHGLSISTRITARDMEHDMPEGCRSWVMLAKDWIRINFL